jgi:hypothetical protein
MWKKATCKYWTGDRTRFKSDSDTVAKRIKYLPLPEIEPGSSISQLVVGYFTDWAIL